MIGKTIAAKVHDFFYGKVLIVAPPPVMYVIENEIEKCNWDEIETAQKT